MDFSKNAGKDTAAAFTRDFEGADTTAADSVNKPSRKNALREYRAQRAAAARPPRECKLKGYATTTAESTLAKKATTNRFPALNVPSSGDSYFSGFTPVEESSVLPSSSLDWVGQKLEQLLRRDTPVPVSQLSSQLSCVSSSRKSQAEIDIILNQETITTTAGIPRPSSPSGLRHSAPLRPPKLAAVEEEEGGTPTYNPAIESHRPYARHFDNHPEGDGQWPESGAASLQMSCPSDASSYATTVIQDGSDNEDDWQTFLHHHDEPTVGPNRDYHKGGCRAIKEVVGCETPRGDPKEQHKDSSWRGHNDSSYSTSAFRRSPTSWHRQPSGCDVTCEVMQQQQARVRGPGNETPLSGPAVSSPEVNVFCTPKEKCSPTLCDRSNRRTTAGTTANSAAVSSLNATLYYGSGRDNEYRRSNGGGSVISVTLRPSSPTAGTAETTRMTFPSPIGNDSLPLNPHRSGGLFGRDLRHLKQPLAQQHTSYRHAIPCEPPGDPTSEVQRRRSLRNMRQPYHVDVPVYPFPGTVEFDDFRDDERGYLHNMRTPDHLVSYTNTNAASNANIHGHWLRQARGELQKKRAPLEIRAKRRSVSTKRRPYYDEEGTYTTDELTFVRKLHTDRPKRDHQHGTRAAEDSLLSSENISSGDSQNTEERYAFRDETAADGTPLLLVKSSRCYLSSTLRGKRCRTDLYDHEDPPTITKAPSLLVPQNAGGQPKYLMVSTTANLSPLNVAASASSSHQEYNYTGNGNPQYRQHEGQNLFEKWRASVPARCGSPHVSWKVHPDNTSLLGFRDQQPSCRSEGRGHAGFDNSTSSAANYHSHLEGGVVYARKVGDDPNNKVIQGAAMNLRRGCDQHHQQVHPPPGCPYGSAPRVEKTSLSARLMTRPQEGPRDQIVKHPGCSRCVSSTAAVSCSPRLRVAPPAAPQSVGTGGMSLSSGTSSGCSGYSGAPRSCVLVCNNHQLDTSYSSVPQYDSRGGYRHQHSRNSLATTSESHDRVFDRGDVGNLLTLNSASSKTKHSGGACSAFAASESGRCPATMSCDTPKDGPCGNLTQSLRHEPSSGILKQNVYMSRPPLQGTPRLNIECRSSYLAPDLSDQAKKYRHKITERHLQMTPGQRDRDFEIAAEGNRRRSSTPIIIAPKDADAEYKRAIRMQKHELSLALQKTGHNADSHVHLANRHSAMNRAAHFGTLGSKSSRETEKMAQQQQPEGPSSERCNSETINARNTRKLASGLRSSPRSVIAKTLRMMRSITSPRPSAASGYQRCGN